MKIAISGARGTVGKEVVKLCAQAGHQQVQRTIQIDRTDEKPDGTPNTEHRTADLASDYEASLKALKGADAFIHLAAIPNPVDKDDYTVHNNNVNSAFIGFRAAGELGIKKITYASSVNAIGLAYANQPLKFDYFPLDEECPQRPTDAYALAKQEAEVQAAAFVNWYPRTSIACLRIHEVAPLKDVRKEHKEDWDNAAVRQLWGWVNPVATARACLLGVTSENMKGFEVFNIVAPNTTQGTPSAELAKKYYPDAQLKSGLEGTKGFWTVDKAKRILGWEHTEKE